MAKTRYERDREKRYMRAECELRGIEVPERANKRQLEAALEAYYKDAALVYTEHGIDLRLTDKPTAEYTVYFTIDVAHRVRAESEEAAVKWIDFEATDFYSSYFGEVDDIGNIEIFDVDKWDD